MELRRLFTFTALLMFAVTHCSGHAMTRRDALYEDYNTPADGSEGTQNDGENGDETNEDAEIQGRIETTPLTYKPTIGTAVRLECKLVPDDDRLLTIWSRNGKQIFISTLSQVPEPDADRYSIESGTHNLIIRDVKVTDNGNFTCTLSFSPPIFSPSITHQLYVYVPPRVINVTSTGNGSVVEGSSLVITCTVTGVPTPDIRWQFIKHSDPESPGKTLTKEDGVTSGNTTVLLKEATYDQSGIYYCYAFFGKDHSEGMTEVRVLGKPRVHVHRNVINSAINIPALLECSVHESVPTIRWLKDGVPVVESSIISISTEGSHSNLTVTPADDNDFGTYTCEAENIYGTHRKSGSLVQKPVVESLDVDGLKLTWVVYSHQPLEAIELQLRGPNGTFTTVDVPLPKDKNRKYEITQILDDKNMEPGNYAAFIRVKNTYDWSETSDELPVKIGKLRVHLHRNVINSAINFPALLECSVYESVPTIRWLKDGVPVVESGIISISTEGSHSNLTVTPADDNDFGTYTCEAENIYGTHRISGSLVQRPVVESMDVDGLKLTWVVYSHQPLEAIELQLRGPNGTFSTVDVPLPKDKNRKYEITQILDDKNMEPGNYAAFIRVKNTYDWSETSDELPVKIVYAEPQPIHIASTFGGDHGGTGSLRPTSTAILATILMYLLVRML